MLDTTSTDFYTLLQISRDASPKDVKTAYHRTLLRLHPDKLPARRRHYNDVTLEAAETSVVTCRPPPEISERENASSVDVALIKEAYKTLSDAGLRAAYDGMSRRQADARARGPRPAQVVSLEEFTVVASGTRGTEAGRTQGWQYGCRCGGMYRIAEDDLEKGTHLVGCESCSEVIWVGYEVAVFEDEPDDV